MHVDAHMTSNECKQHAKGQWCVWGCNWSRRVCHRFARDQPCRPDCRYVHLPHQHDGPNHEQQAEPKAMPRVKSKAAPKAGHPTPRNSAMPKVKSKTTPKRQTVSTKTAEALRVLGLDPESRSISKRQIATNYRNQALIYHPDKHKNPVNKRNAETLFSKIKTAYDGEQFS